MRSDVNYSMTDTFPRLLTVKFLLITLIHVHWIFGLTSVFWHAKTLTDSACMSPCYQLRNCQQDRSTAWCSVRPLQTSSGALLSSRREKSLNSLDYIKLLKANFGHVWVVLMHRCTAAKISPTCYRNVHYITRQNIVDPWDYFSSYATSNYCNVPVMWTATTLDLLLYTLVPWNPNMLTSKDCIFNGSKLNVTFFSAGQVDSRDSVFVW
jgi:hypothetical protein